MWRAAVSNPSPGISPVALLVVASAFWGIATVISKGVLASVRPVDFLVAQLAPSVVVLWVIALSTGARLGSKRGSVPILLLGCLNPGLSYTFSILGLSRTTASVASLLWAAEPALIVAMAWFLLGERPGARLIVATASAALGMLLVIGLASDTSAAADGWGYCLVLAGVICCAIYTVLSRRLVTSADPLLIVTMQQSAGLGWVVVILCLMPAGPGHSMAMLSLTEWVGATVSGLMYYAAAFWCYLIGLRSLSASVAGGSLNLIPVFAIGTAHVALGEHLDRTQWIGAITILLSVLAVLLPGGPRWQPGMSRKEVSIQRDD
jgi:drug/metabolite transporter (DMT)-like permease